MCVCVCVCASWTSCTIASPAPSTTTPPSSAASVPLPPPAAAAAAATRILRRRAGGTFLQLLERFYSFSSVSIASRVPYLQHATRWRNPPLVSRPPCKGVPLRPVLGLQCLCTDRPIVDRHHEKVRIFSWSCAETPRGAQRHLVRGRHVWDTNKLHPSASTVLEVLASPRARPSTAAYVNSCAAQRHLT